MSSYARTIQRRILKKRKAQEIPVMSARSGKFIGSALPLYAGQIFRSNV